MSERRIMIAGNWKMNLSTAQACSLVKEISKGISDIGGIDVLVAPPFIHIPAVREAMGESKIFLSAQNMCWEKNGAFTGEISPDMLKEAGCTHVILGHSERRTIFSETSELIDRKVSAAIEAKLVPIICVGETLEQREGKITFDVIDSQLKGSLKNLKAEGSGEVCILAYEPVWAIGTGLTATPEQAQEVHRFIRKGLMSQFNQEFADRTRILYGGSVKPDNARELMNMPDIDGALVGGASLKADSFLKIIRYKY